MNFKPSWKAIEELISNIKLIIFIVYIFIALPISIYLILEQGNSAIRWALLLILIFPYVWSEKKKR